MFTINAELFSLSDGDKHPEKMAEYFEYEFKVHQRNIANTLALCNSKNKPETCNEELIQAVRRLVSTKPDISTNLHQFISH